ncbi:MAG TPA: T9SS type A sorting domain-containing protein [Bacteroidetes bacterium]|nr:T9SS type A sorting domain-containing protein [Bacteroidota bacterium]
MRFIFQTGFLVLFTWMAVFSQSHNWQRTNPGGGGAFSTIGAGPTGIVLAGSDLSGAYRSLDGGQSWDVIGSYRGLTATHVSGLGFHPFDGNILYLGTDEGIFRSANGGTTVEQVLDEGYITDIEIARGNPLVGYASYHPVYDSNNGAVYKTTDNGLTWFSVSDNLPGGLRILKLLVHPGDENTLWLLSGEGRFACGPAQVWRSTDGGVNWQLQASALGEILDIGMDRAEPPTLYLTTMNADCNATYYWTDLDGVFYKSIDLGQTWQLMANRTGVVWPNWQQPGVVRLIDPREPYPWVDVAGTWQSDDGGNTWVQTGFVDDWDYGYQGVAFWSYGTSFNGIAKTLGEDLSDPDRLYWTNTQWAYGSSDGGRVFNNLHTREVSEGWWQSTGFDNVNMMDVAISEANPDLVYLAFFDIGLWRSFDNGESWQSCNTAEFTGDWEGYGGNSASVLADPERELVVWATLSAFQNGEAPTYLLRSDNAGEKSSWQNAGAGLPDSEIMGLSLDPNSPVNNRTLFVTALGHVYRSTNDGLAWTKVLHCGDCRFTAVDRFDGSLVYAGGGAGFWRSADGGSNWEEAGLPEMAGDPDIGFWNWGWTGIFDIETDPNQPGRVCVSSFGPGKGLWCSDDGGLTWNKLLTDDYMRSLAIAPQNSDILYVTSSSALESGGFEPGSGGVFFSDNGGAGWTQVNDGMAWPFAAVAEVSRSGWVFIGSPGTGFQKSLVPIPVNNTSVPKRRGDFSLFPNPNNGFFDVYVPDPGSGASATVFNFSGDVVFFKNLEKGKNFFALSRLSAGIYFIKIAIDGHHESQMLAVQ